MFANDLAHRRQSQPVAGWPGGEEGFENASKRRFIHALPGIADDDAEHNGPVRFHRD